MGLNIIKGLARISQKITQEQLIELERKALQYRKFFKLNIKIMALSEEDKALIIAVNQEKLTDNTPYFTSAEMVEEMRKLFSPFFEDYTLKIGATPYTDPPASVVTAQWIKQQMQKYHIGSKKVAQAIGIAPAEISALINAHREMGIRTKSMFYYYFKYIEQQKK